jgi:hypothetical protein
MTALFKWLERAIGTSADGGALGSSDVAQRVLSGSLVPPGCVGLVVDDGGRMLRVAEGARLVLNANQCAYCFHPGPYGVDLQPFAAAPEVGLRVHFVVNTPDPRVPQQRFDLFLASEAGATLSRDCLRAAIEHALRQELEQGQLDLPPCTSLAEWHAFRAHFNELLYTRFGLTVDDCVPADLAGTVDYASMLQARAAGTAPMAASVPRAAPVASADMAAADAAALRRLFLELPCVMHGLRQTVLPSGQTLFHQHQALLQRLDHVSLVVATMPALTWAAPDRPLPMDQQRRRALHSARAVRALDEAWAMLARLKQADARALPAMFDDADRIVANLERDSEGRRVAIPEGEPT